MSFLSCRSISAFIRFCSFCSSERQHAILSAKVLIMHYSSQSAAAAAAQQLLLTLHTRREWLVFDFSTEMSSVPRVGTPFERGQRSEGTLEGRPVDFLAGIMTHSLEKKVFFLVEGGVEKTAKEGRPPSRAAAAAAQHNVGSEQRPSGDEQPSAAPTAEIKQGKRRFCRRCRLLDRTKFGHSTLPAAAPRTTTSSGCLLDGQQPAGSPRSPHGTG